MLLGCVTKTEEEEEEEFIASFEMLGLDSDVWAIHHGLITSWTRYRQFRDSGLTKHPKL